MKIQDILFLVVFLFLLYRFKPQLTTLVGLTSGLFAIPFFALWVFFTAERLTWYAASFFFLAVVQYTVILRREAK